MEQKWFKDRCCGKWDRGPLMSISKAIEDPEDRYCTHDFFLVRIDQATGEVEYIPNLAGPYVLQACNVNEKEWRKGPLPEPRTARG